MDIGDERNKLHTGSTTATRNSRNLHTSKVQAVVKWDYGTSHSVNLRQRVEEEERREVRLDRRESRQTLFRLPQLQRSPRTIILVAYK
jgi:hypothetical protein